MEPLAMSDKSKDTFSYGRTNAAYWDEQYPGVFAPFKLQGATKHANLSQPTPRKPKRTVATMPLRAPERAGDVAIVPLPMPASELQPNRKTKVNPYKLTRIIKATRAASAFIAGQVRPPEPWLSVLVDVRLYGAGRMDRDNIIGFLKHSIDGLQDARLIQNDSGVTWGAIERRSAKQSDGRREVEITVTNLGTA
jgi:Holliday junction resolvase RusA-like endonuclease